MNTIFLSHAREDGVCADQIRQGVEPAGYTVWREPDYPTESDVSYPQVVENAMLGSAAVVILWSRSAAQSPWSKRHILIAQRFSKPLVPVMLDETALPGTLLEEGLVGEIPCDALVSSLLPRLPATDSQDPLLKLCEKAAQSFIRERKAAIDQAAEMLAHGEQTKEVLAILEYLAQKDVMNGVREKAQGVLDAVARHDVLPSPSSISLQDARYKIKVRCQNGHITIFDKRKICTERTVIMRGLDELILTCATCNIKMAVDIDCEGY